MRVALAFPGCNRRGGVERVMVECAHYLHGRGHEVRVVTSECDEGVLPTGVNVHLVPRGFGPGWSNVGQFGRAAEKALGALGGPRAEVLGSFGAASPAGGVVWVQSVHRAWLHISAKSRSFTGTMKQRVNPAHYVALHLENYIYGGRRYRRLIALTEDVRDDLIHYYGVPKADISILPNGYAPGEFSAERAYGERLPVRNELGYDLNDKVVVFAANEHERKGLIPLLHAIASLGLEANLRLLAVGKLDERHLKPIVRKLGLAGRVVFAGPSADVGRFYAAGDIFALPTYYEAWGLVIVEALACGLPVLTSRVAGASVAVKEGWSGELLDDPHSVEEIARKLRVLLQRDHPPREAISTSVAEYAWPVVLQKYERILQESASQ